MMRLCASTLLWLAMLVLTACAQHPPLPEQTPALDLPLQLHVQRQDTDGVSDWILIVQQEGPALRWSLLDPLGVPLARQLLVDGRWQADGLLPPNPQARALFAALLFALTPSADLHQLYPGRDVAEGPGWRSLMLNAASTWHVRYGKNQRFDLDVGPSLTYGVAPIESAAGAVSQ